MSQCQQLISFKAQNLAADIYMLAQLAKNFWQVSL
jgi:hypothetical protein